MQPSLLIWFTKPRKTPITSPHLLTPTDNTWYNYMLPSVLIWLTNIVVVLFILARIFIFGEPVTRSNSKRSISYWRFRKQADLDMERVGVMHINNSPIFSPPPPLPTSASPYLRLSPPPPLPTSPLSQLSPPLPFPTAPSLPSTTFTAPLSIPSPPFHSPSTHLTFHPLHHSPVHHLFRPTFAEGLLSGVPAFEQMPGCPM